MSGLFALLYGALLGGAKIADGIDNLQAKQEVYTLPNGIRYYFDNKGTQRLMDGTIIIADCAGTFKTIDGRLLYSKNDEENKKAASTVTQNKYKYATQHNSRIRGFATVELTTGKAITRVEEIKKKDGTYEYRKWYFEDANNEGVPISAEEFNAINTCPIIDSILKNHHHDLYVNGKKDVIFYAYSKPWYKEKSGEVELAQKFVKDGGQDGWYKEKVEPDWNHVVCASPNYTKYWKIGDIYVKNGYAIKRRRQVHGEYIEEYPYCREAGDRWFSVKLSYISFSQYKEDTWTWIEKEPTNIECYHFDYLLKKEEPKMKLPKPIE